MQKLVDRRVLSSLRGEQCGSLGIYSIWYVRTDRMLSEADYIIMNEFAGRVNTTVNPEV